MPRTKKRPRRIGEASSETCEKGQAEVRSKARSVHTVDPEWPYGGFCGFCGSCAFDVVVLALAGIGRMSLQLAENPHLRSVDCVNVFQSVAATIESWHVHSWENQATRNHLRL